MLIDKHSTSPERGALTTLEATMILGDGYIFATNALALLAAEDCHLEAFAVLLPALASPAFASLGM